jgi:hypothetical protein
MFLRGHLLVIVGMIHVACSGHQLTEPTLSQSPNVPAAPIAPRAAIDSRFGGVWRGEYKPTSCSASRQSRFCLGGLLRFTLHLEESGRVVTGTLFVAEELIDVRGSIDQNGDLLITGRREPVSRYDHAAVLNGMTLRLDDAGYLAGSLDYAIDYQDDPYSYAPTIIRGDISSSVYTAMADSSFSGRWYGRFVVRDCTPYSDAPFCRYDAPGWLDFITLEINQSGPSVSGIVTIYGNHVPVSGSASGDNLTLAGEDLQPGSAMAFRITDWTSRRDRFDKLTGRVAFAEGSRGQYLIDLVDVTRTP